MPNPRTRARRLKLFAIPFLLAGALAYGSVHQIWYTAVLAPTTVQQQPVSANLTITAAQIAQLSTTPSATATGASGLDDGNTNPSVGSKFGIIDPIFYVMAAALLGALGMMAGSLLLTIGSMLSSFFAWTALTSLRTQFENPLTTGGFTLTRGAGQARLWLALTIMLGFGMLALVQVFLVHRAERIANNEPGLVTHITTSLGRHAATLLRDVTRQDENV
jgi:hypothetical protein